MTFGCTQQHICRSLVVHKSIAFTDALGFYTDVFMSTIGLVVYGGYHALVCCSPVVPSVMMLFMAFLARGTELFKPKFYRKWRWTFIRCMRYWHVVYLFVDALKFSTTYSSGQLDQSLIEPAFTYHKLKSNTTVVSMRGVLLAGGGVLGMFGTFRRLPFKEQLIVQMIYCFHSLLLVAPLGTVALGKPAFAEGNINLCCMLTGAPKDFALRNDLCGPRTPARLVLFAHFHLVLLLPMYITFQQERRMRNAVALSMLRLQQPGIEARAGAVVRENSWWVRLLVDVTVLLYTAAIMWRLLLMYDQAVLDLLAPMQQWAASAGAELYSRIAAAAELRCMCQR